MSAERQAPLWLGAVAVLVLALHFLGDALLPFVVGMANMIVSVLMMVACAGALALLAPILKSQLLGDWDRRQPAWLIFALLAGGTLLGFVGVMMAVPVAAAIGVVARITADRFPAGPLCLDVGDELPQEGPSR